MMNIVQCDMKSLYLLLTWRVSVCVCTLISMRKSRRCSLNRGMSLLRWNSPSTNTRICKLAKATNIKCDQVSYTCKKFSVALFEPMNILTVIIWVKQQPNTIPNFVPNCKQFHPPPKHRDRYTHSCMCGNACLSSCATYSCTYRALDICGFSQRRVPILSSSTKLNMNARIVACIVRPAGGGQWAHTLA